MFGDIDWPTNASRRIVSISWASGFNKRTQQTRVGDCYCLLTEVDLINRVVQGSSIGPVSFLIYADELAKLLERRGVVVKLFADDVKVYLEICNASDATTLQNALDLIADWANEWQRSLSVNTCNILPVGKHLDYTQYYISGKELPCFPIAET